MKPRAGRVRHLSSAAATLADRLDRDQRTRIDYDAQGLSGDRSAAPILARSSANVRSSTDPLTPGCRRLRESDTSSNLEVADISTHLRTHEEAGQAASRFRRRACRVSPAARALAGSTPRSRGRRCHEGTCEAGELIAPEHVERAPSFGRRQGRLFEQRVRFPKHQERRRLGCGNHVDTMLDGVVNQHVEMQRPHERAPGPSGDDHAGEVDAVLHEPPLSLALNRVPRVAGRWVKKSSWVQFPFSRSEVPS